MVVTYSKLASLAIAIVYVAAGVFTGDATLGDITRLCMMLLIPLALIWFPDELGTVAPMRRGGKWTTQGGIWSESPGVLVATMGWFFLVGMPIIFYLLWS
jgi:hypothetical protein